MDEFVDRIYEKGGSEKERERTRRRRRRGGGGVEGLAEKGRACRLQGIKTSEIYSWHGLVCASLDSG